MRANDDDRKNADIPAPEGVSSGGEEESGKALKAEGPSLPHARLHAIVKMPDGSLHAIRMKCEDSSAMVSLVEECLASEENLREKGIFPLSVILVQARREGRKQGERPLGEEVLDIGEGEADDKSEREDTPLKENEIFAPLFRKAWQEGIRKGRREGFREALLRVAGKALKRGVSREAVVSLCDITLREAEEIEGELRQRRAK